MYSRFLLTHSCQNVCVHDQTKICDSEMWMSTDSIPWCERTLDKHNRDGLSPDVLWWLPRHRVGDFHHTFVRSQFDWLGSGGSMFDVHISFLRSALQFLTTASSFSLDERGLAKSVSRNSTLDCYSCLSLSFFQRHK